MTTPYTPQFFANHSEGSRKSALRILPLVFELARPASVVDVGCGVGTWLNACQSLGIGDIVGIDGEYVAKNQLEIPAERFVTADLATLAPAQIATRSPLLNRRFELAISMEVGEHLPAQAAHPFVETLCALAPIVLFSAAITCQGGNNHVNEQMPSYWVEHFKQNGYDVIDAIRWHVWSDRDVEWWYRQNTLLFASQEALAQNAALRQARAQTRDSMIDVVHPMTYRQALTWLFRLYDQTKGGGGPTGPGSPGTSGGGSGPHYTYTVVR